MRRREIGWAIFLAGLPFSPFIFFQTLDLWHSEALWAQSWVILLFALSLGSNVSRSWITNKPLAALIIWAAAVFLWKWNTTMLKMNIYPLPMLMGMGHLFIIVLFYLTAIRTWSFRTIQVLLKWIGVSGALVLAYCIVQLLNLDQFLNNIDSWTKEDALVGTIGNPSHLGTQLALLTPVFFYNKGWYWKVLGFTSIGVAVATGSTGALVALGIGLCYLLWFYNRWASGLLSLCGVGALSYLVIYKSNLVDFNGRLDAWSEFFKMFKHEPITGKGLGFIMENSRQDIPNTILLKWRHVHLEYFQVAIELGLIGLSLLFWLIYDTIKKVFMTRTSRELVTLSTILLIFMINSLVSYPAHLWVLGSFGLLAYSGIYVLAKEGL